MHIQGFSTVLVSILGLQKLEEEYSLTTQRMNSKFPRMEEKTQFTTAITAVGE
ncbi:MAG: hypothetical protein ACD_52C00104G0002 [uncultured bacterium]|nr:MAG: hypothetical protein ACD_52C00104G0002 [uncultured bacterium]